MDRPKVTQRYLNYLPVPDDMPALPWVQWRVENVDEIREFLEDFAVRIRKHDRPLVAPLRDDATLLCNLALEPDELFPHLGVVGHGANDRCHFRCTDLFRDVFTVQQHSILTSNDVQPTLQ